MTRLLTWTFLLLVVASCLTFVHADADDVPDEDDIEIYEDEEDVHDDDEPIMQQQQDDVYEEEETDSLASPDISAVPLFPDHPTKKFVVGEDATVLVQLTNNGPKTFNVSFVGGSLHSPFDFNYYIQNFTGSSVNAILPPNGQMSLSYTFQPEEKLEALEYWLSAGVVYNSSETGRIYQTTFVNGTVTLVDAKSGFGIQSIFSYAIGLGGLVLLGYVAVKAMDKNQGKVAVVASDPKTVAESWAQDVYTPKPVSSRSKGKKGKRKGRKGN